MSNIPLKTIKFPGLDDTYTVPVVDNTLATAGAAADAKKTGDEITSLKQDFNEYHPDLGSGYSAQLLSTVFIENEVPYNFRTSGGSADIGDREYDEIVGVSMPVNQLAGSQDRTVSANGITISFDHSTGKTTVTVPDSPTGYAQLVYYGTPAIAGHRYLICTDKPLANGIEVYIGGTNGIRGLFPAPKNQTAIETATASSTTLQLYVGQSTAAGTYEYYAQIVDLTLTLGTAIADYVLGLEQSTAGSGVTWLKHHFPKIFDSGYIPYNAGEIQSVSGLSLHRMTGFNQCKENWRQGDWNNLATPTRVSLVNADRVHLLGGNTYNISIESDGDTYAVSGALLDEIDSTSYFATISFGTGRRTYTPPKDCYLALVIRKGSDDLVTPEDVKANCKICISLRWDGERDGEYEEYKEYEYALDDSVVLRGILKLDSSNSLYADGDRYLADGTLDRRFGVVDLGTLNWVKKIISSDTFFQSDGLRGVIKPPVNNSTIADCVCPVFKFVPWNSSERGNFICAIAGANDSYAGRISCQYSAASTAEEFKSAMSGVYMVYPLATPTTETAEPYQTPQIVDDWGTEEYVSTSLVPVGHDTKYANNLRAKLEMSPDSPEEDGDYIVRHNNGENEYVALGSTTTIQSILDRLTALENA